MGKPVPDFPFDPEPVSLIGCASMKYKLETIPVWDAVQREEKTCIICFLMEQSEQRKITFYLGNSVMNPETRVRVNTQGFCPDHYRKLIGGGKPLSLGLMAHTRLQETWKQVDRAVHALGSSSSPRSVKKAALQLESVMEGREAGCLICEGMSDNLNRYLYTTAHLWGAEQEFREAFRDSGGVCLHHLSFLAAMAPEALGKGLLGEFCSELVQNSKLWMERTLDEVQWLTQRNKSENSGMDWKGCEQAHARAVLREIGSGRIVSPSRRK